MKFLGYICKKSLTYNQIYIAMKNVFLFLFMLLAVSHVSVAQTEPDTAAINALDAGLPKVSPYYMQHQFLSVIAPEVPVSDGFVFSEPEILNTYMAAHNGFRSPFRDEDIAVDSVSVADKMVYVWRFPEPEYLREALYMAFVPVDGKFVPYAICIGQLVDWEVSVSTQSYRGTYGRIKRPDSAQECVDLLVGRGALTSNISPGDFFQEGYKGPEYRPTE